MMGYRAHRDIGHLTDTPWVSGAGGLRGAGTRPFGMILVLPDMGRYSSYGIKRQGHTVSPAQQLGQLCDEYFALVHTLDPFTATQLGVPGFDGLVPDPSRAGAARGAALIAAIERRLADLDT